MAILTPTFGSADLTNYFDTFTETIVNRFNAVRVPQRHGNVLQVPTLSEKKVTLTGKYITTDAETARNDVSSLTSELINKGQDKLRLYDDRYLECRLESLTPSITDNTGMATIELNARFRADQIPFWQGNGLINVTDGNVDSGDILIITNTGNAPTAPLFTITNATGSATSIQIIHSNSSYWTYNTLSNGSVLTVDCRSLIVLVNSAVAISEWSGSFFDIDPGVNSLQFIGAGGASMTVNLSIWPRWYTY